MNNLLLIQPKKILKKLYPKAIWNFNRDENVIYLSFDDGPIPGLTEWVLGELERYKAKATFFRKNSTVFVMRFSTVLYLIKPKYKLGY